jgi:hypothetical protein
MAVAYAIYFVDGAPQMYTLLYLATFCGMSYCYEKWMRIWFIRTMLGDESTRSEAIAQEQRQQLIRDQDILKLRQELEQLNREKEHEALVLRSSKEKELMCNVMSNVVRDIAQK